MKKLITMLLLAPGIASAQNLDLEALKEIRTFAEEFCGELFEGGEGQSFNIDGTAQANLKGFAKKLADIGFEGAVGFDDSKYLGVLHEDLAGERSSTRDCKLLLWNDLKATVVQVPKESGSAQMGFLYPFTASTWLTNKDLRQYSSSDLRIMRNEIYARYGYDFKSADLRSHFGAQSWYQPVTSDAEAAYGKMSAVERSNVLTIRKEERER